MGISLNEKSRFTLKKISKLKFAGGEPERAIEALYDKINEIIDSVSRQDGHVRSLAKGKPGDTRVVRKGGADYRLEVRTDKGWANVPIELNTD